MQLLRFAGKYLVYNVELWLLRGGAVHWIILDCLQQVISIPSEGLLARSPQITLVVASTKAEHTPGKHAGGPCKGGSDFDRPCSNITPAQPHLVCTMPCHNACCGLLLQLACS